MPIAVKGFKIEVDEDSYQLVGPGGEESGVTEYEDVAEVTCEDVLYFVTVADEDDAEDAAIHKIVGGHPEVLEDQEREVEEVEFEVEDETEDE